ncbi:MAG TPA: hypothetical protein ACFYD4_16745 [Candidatus Wunengus sp. YC61]|uniref:hypothetical protein n=1 Tax=Candidatus Wunengus sp. YC61 TaxID=3367698 RepID=UPI004029E999
MPGEIIAIIALLVVICGLIWLIMSMHSHFKEVTSDLLNRIMSRNFETYVQAEVAKVEAEKPLTPEEIYARQYEQGIPV